jgi:hypothetical protein
MTIQTRALFAVVSTLLFCGLLRAQITGVTAGTDLTGGGTSGNVVLNLDTTKVPRLATANTFTTNQTVKGNLSASGIVTGGIFQIGSDLWGYGSFANGNAYLGFGGNTASVGTLNTATGYQALLEDTNGSGNSAYGANAMALTDGGGYNTAIGVGSLAWSGGNGNSALGASSGIGSTTGTYNTFLGFNTSASVDPLNNSGAIGAFASVGVNNAIILGGTASNAVTVGIGTSKPYSDYALDVDTTNSNGIINGGVVVNASGGNLYLGMTNGTHKFRVSTSGVAYADGGFVASGADFAESVAVRGQSSEYEPGDVLEIDANADRHLALSHHAYATLVAGIYSTKPGVLATSHNIDDPSAKSTEVPLAVIGIVPCKVTDENGAIARGDLLVTSSRPGYAMKGTDRSRFVGAVVGKALQPLAAGTGMIEVLITLQ